MTTIHTLLAVTSLWEWSISQLDVKMPFLVVNYVRMFACAHDLGILSLRVWFQRFASVITAADFSLVLMIQLFLSTCHLVVRLFSFFTSMI
jgi:hypothetical protein